MVKEADGSKCEHMTSNKATIENDRLHFIQCRVRNPNLFSMVNRPKCCRIWIKWLMKRRAIEARKISPLIDNFRLALGASYLCLFGRWSGVCPSSPNSLFYSLYFSGEEWTNSPDQKRSFTVQFPGRRYDAWPPESNECQTRDKPNELDSKLGGERDHIISHVLFTNHPSEERGMNIRGRSETRRIRGLNALPQRIRENIRFWIDFNIDVLANYKLRKICA
jgi:hypothetical protein